MKLGFNYPWSRQTYGSQIGPNPAVSDEEWKRNSELEAAGTLDKLPLPPLFDHVDRNLANLKKMGLEVVRWFLLGNGSNYIPAPIPTHVPSEPWVSGAPSVGIDTVYRFSPPAHVDRRFARDFKELLKRFSDAKMQIIPSLIDFRFGADLLSGHDPRGHWYGGRADVIRVPSARKAFLDTILVEMLAASAGFEETIFAWEIMNEPVHLTLRYGILSRQPWTPRRAEITVPQLQDFLHDAVARINKAGFKSTIGHRYFDDMAIFYSTESKRQFHYYANTHYYNLLGGGKRDPDLTGIFQRNSPKAFLGEFSASDGRPERWDYGLFRSYQPDTTLARLKRLEAEGCELALIWSNIDTNFEKDPRDKTDAVYNANIEHYINNDGLKLTDAARRDLVAFTGGKLPPAGE